MSIIAIDYETYLINAEHPNPKPVCLSWYDGSNRGLIAGIEPIQDFLKEHLSNGTTFIAHNAKFELLVTYEHFPELRELLWQSLDNKQWFCTALSEKLKRLSNSNNANGKLSLATLVMEYFNIDLSAEKTDPNAWRLRYSELDGIPLDQWPEDAKEYAIMDSVYAYRLWELLYKYPSWAQLRATLALNLMGLTGFTVSKERAVILKNELKDLIAPIYDNLESYGMVEVRKGKTFKCIKKLQEHISNILGDKAEKTAKGVVRTDKQSLRRYLERVDDNILKQFSQLGRFEKIMSSYIPVLEKANPVVKTVYNPLVDTNRTSSGGDKNFPSTNMQQPPRGIDGVTYDFRACFVPRPGYSIVSIDYSGLELAACANQLHAFYGESTMADLLNSGDEPLDAHSNFARYLKASKEGVLFSYEEFVGSKKLKGFAEYRKNGKPFQLSIPGGGGYDTLRTIAYQIGRAHV
jgi:DNA polymerase I-like protein with 3'-5' exonuclease and polymerase domains